MKDVIKCVFLSPLNGIDSENRVARKESGKKIFRVRMSYFPESGKN